MDGDIRHRVNIGIPQGILKTNSFGRELQALHIGIAIISSELITDELTLALLQVKMQ
jgi:hypothetical protein